MPTMSKTTRKPSVTATQEEIAPTTQPKPSGDKHESVTSVNHLADLLAPILVAKLDTLFTERVETVRRTLEAANHDFSNLSETIQAAVTAGVVDAHRAIAMTTVAKAAPAPEHVKEVTHRVDAPHPAASGDILGGTTEELMAASLATAGKKTLGTLDLTLSEYVDAASEAITAFNDWHTQRCSDSSSTDEESSDAAKMAKRFAKKDWNVLKLLEIGAVTLCECGAAGVSFSGGVMPDKGNSHNDHNIWLMADPPTDDDDA